MKLTHAIKSRLKGITLLRTAYCFWRIRYYRQRQRANFGKSVGGVNSGKKNWQENIGGEVNFWDETLAEGNFKERLEPAYLQSPELGEVLERFLPIQTIRAIDVGCGPLSTLGREYKGMKIERSLADPLASSYYPMLERMRVPRELWPDECEGEELTTRYPEKHYQLVYMSNALDHCHDPFAVIDQLGKLVAPGGLIYMEHFENEAEKENYHGLHQWNLYEQNNELWIANRWEKKSLSQILGPNFKIDARPVYRHGGFVIVTAFNIIE
jgi:SAM-dependent methyltransferase